LRHAWRSSPERLLRVCENVSLGERSSINVVQFGQQRFLLGVTNGSLAVLATLSEPACRSLVAGIELHRDDIPGNDVPTWALRDGCYRRES
jgi:flagellar biogenesis protein FliO